MKALTLHPWWAWLVVHGHKPTENRSWSPPAGIVGSMLAIHAGVRRASATDRDLLRGQLNAAGVPHLLDAAMAAPRGRIVGTVRVVGVDGRCTSPWDIDGLQHWRLADAAVLDGPTLPGRLGIWTWDQPEGAR